MPKFKINLNGDSRETFQAEISNLYQKLVEVENAVKAITVHPRNYQTCDDPQAAYKADMAEKMDAYDNIIAVREWADSLATQLVRQME